MTLTTIAPTIDANGITAPTYADVLAYLQDQYRSIYGADTYLEPDSQDGQLLGVFAKAISDVNSVAIAIYRSFSPATAQDDALSSNVKINGIARKAASYSSADLVLIGQAGKTITNGAAKDTNGVMWLLPATVTIPPSGTITVTATCAMIGDVSARAGTINQIATPALGWQSVTNPADAAEGAPVEKDAVLRQRQTVSTALPSLTVLDGIIGAVANVPGVTRYVAYENDTNATDANGIPSHSISLVVEGGDATAIANAIAAKKTPGAGTYGTTAVIVTDIYGRPITIRFFRPVAAPIAATVTIKALTGYTSQTGQQIQQAVSDYINGVQIGGGLSGSVEWGDALTAANSVGGGTTFKLSGLTLTGPRGAGTPDVALLFNEAASCTPADVTLVVN
ncbi:baseplate J/gp47 family protein [Burkholderia cenocepacia]|uniref:baseplate J/gp47 family protein n=1 Tax=Burkholderia cenocepacia TaxID=95486 RepID=UPI001BA0C284|nr:baseplate J/gp47 family protein [Burkholderia cenocepacia]MBR8025241.1 baseplate J/gp47 family protein [Burkholderia cenocepacia]MBR8173952.1 baseplate J/gp47 family protein [Burkholderia cenocepacia]